jgi:hypothetical protein
MPKAARNWQWQAYAAHFFLPGGGTSITLLHFGQRIRFPAALSGTRALFPHHLHSTTIAIVSHPKK